jgi:23S rRNA (uracil1939-C5)-methyltransferase/tRNA (uracil-5-)-methyltransferase
VTLDVPACPIATPAVNARLAELRADVLARWSGYRRGATLLVREASSGVTVDPRDVVTEQVGDLSLRFLAGDFFQNNPFLLPRLVAHVARERRPAARASSSTPTAAAACWGWRRRRISNACSASRSAPAPVSWARENAARNARANCEYLAADASAVFAAIPFAGADAAVIVDPPRKGCGDAFLAQLAAFAPRTIVYVSCNPETQARDVAVAGRAGYTCLRVQPFDMFPQTRTSRRSRRWCAVVSWAGANLRNRPLTRASRGRA